MKNLYLPLTFFSQKKTKMSSHLFTVIWYAATVVDCVFVWFVGVPGTQLNEYLPFKWFHVRRYTERMWHVDGISVEKNQCRQHRSGKSIVNPFIGQYMQYLPVAHHFLCFSYAACSWARIACNWKLSLRSNLECMHIAYWWQREMWVTIDIAISTTHQK